jgi:hypothetical protein
MKSLDLDLLPDGGVSWLDASGPDAHIVLSTRIRLARNLEGLRFTPRADDAEPGAPPLGCTTRPFFGSIGSRAASGSCSTSGT